MTINRIGCSGRCLISEYKGEGAPGQTVEGHGIATYDAVRKKYVESWTDGMSSSISTTEYTYNAASRTFAGSMSTTTSADRAVTLTLNGELGDPGRRTFRIFGPDGRGGRRPPIIVCAMVR